MAGEMKTRGKRNQQWQRDDTRVEEKQKIKI